MFREFQATLNRVAFLGLLAGTGMLSAVNLLSAADEEALSIGSDAPALDVEHWVQNGNGKFKPVTKFANGKVYVVEFWATWCGPCISSMPHIVELQKDYADKGVQVISISDEDLETVEQFLEGEVRGGKKVAPRKDKAAVKDKADDEDKAADKEDKPMTYKELTSSYCLTADPDRSVHIDYMESAGQNGIPTAFIVGKDQKIEWIGHPMSMDEPLAAIVAGTWDRQKFGDEFKERQMLDTMMTKISTAMRKGDSKAALEIVEEGLANAKSDELKMQLGLYRLQLQLNDKDSVEQLPEIITEAYQTYADQGQLINMIAWTLVQKMEAGELENEEVLRATRVAIEKAAKQGEGDQRAAILDTAAHVQSLSGDLDAAIKSQTTAIELAAPQLKAQLQDYLDELKEKKEGKSDKEDAPGKKPSPADKAK